MQLEDTIAITNMRSDYVAYHHIWEKCRDVVAGAEVVKSDAKCTTYLPRLSGHDYTPEGNAAYATYLAYAHFYGATGRTVDGLKGLVFRRDPLLQAPETIKPFLENITFSGQSVIEFAKDVLEEVLITNRCGIFIDLPQVDTDIPMSVAEMNALNIRPYVRMYQAESIVNWREEIIDNVKQTTLVVLKESIEAPSTNVFTTKWKIQYRLLFIDDDGVYRQALYIEDEDHSGSFDVVAGKTLKLDGVFTPVVRGQTLDYIPFYPVTDQGITWDLKYPSIIELVNTNINHYHNSALRENGLIWTGNPTPVFAGYAGSDDSTIRLGSTTAILLQNGGHAEYLEFSGKGLSEITDAMHDKAEEMALLGARIIATDKKAAETAETASIHRAGEQSVLANMANSVSHAITKVLNFYLQFIGSEETAIMELNTDYLAAQMNYALFKSLSEQVGKTISWETYVWNLQRGEILPPGIDAENESVRLLASESKLQSILESNSDSNSQGSSDEPDEGDSN